MAYRVIWSSQAVEDVDAIAAYIARDSPSYAAAIVQKILQKTRSLKDNPSAGSMIPEFGESTLQEQQADSYRVIYQIQDEKIVIAAVIHSRSLLHQEE
jgi:toxin ParE1/3/4